MEEFYGHLVGITPEEYKEAVKASVTLDYLVRFLLDDSRLSWDKKSLVLEHNLDVLKVICPAVHDARLNKLKAEAENGTDND